MDIFEFEDYKQLVISWVASMPKKGRGQWTKMAAHLGVHSVVLSQVFRGDKELSLDQAWHACEFMGLSELETEYVLALVQRSRAVHFRLKAHFSEKIKELRSKSLDLKKRLRQDQELTEETRAIFYSNWYYSGIRLAADNPELASVEAIAERLRLPLALVKKVVEFLLEHQLCVRKENRVAMGPARIHVGVDSPLVSRHHMNWRMKGLQKMENVDHNKELFFTGPYSLARDLLPKIRKQLVKVVDECTSQVVASDSETLACLNIDWFEV